MITCHDNQIDVQTSVAPTDPSLSKTYQTKGATVLNNASNLCPTTISSILNDRHVKIYESDYWALNPNVIDFEGEYLFVGNPVHQSGVIYPQAGAFTSFTLRLKVDCDSVVITLDPPDAQKFSITPPAFTKLSPYQSFDLDFWQRSSLVAPVTHLLGQEFVNPHPWSCNIETTLYEDDNNVYRTDTLPDFQISLDNTSSPHTISLEKNVNYIFSPMTRQMVVKAVLIEETNGVSVPASSIAEIEFNLNMFHDCSNFEKNLVT